MKGALKSLNFPLEMYADDVSSIVGTCIDLYGLEEWRAVVLTNEIHGHLGIYSTIGAKMGIRATEVLRGMGCECPPRIVSFAGNVPPVSCLNDGLQVSTGASMGHGLFSVSTVSAPCVKARFTAGGRTISMSLKPSFQEQIKADIQKGTALYGHSPAYWEYVRKLAVRYWRELDRLDIFTFQSED